MTASVVRAVEPLAAKPVAAAEEEPYFDISVLLIAAFLLAILLRVIGLHNFQFLNESFQLLFDILVERGGTA